MNRLTDKVVLLCVMLAAIEASYINPSEVTIDGGVLAESFSATTD
jgi:hypothetical protein